MTLVELPCAIRLVPFAGHLKVQAAAAAAERVKAASSGPGRELVAKAVEALRQRWEHYTADLGGQRAELESALAQWSEWDDQVSGCMHLQGGILLFRALLFASVLNIQ